MTRCTSSWHLCFTVFSTLSFRPDALFSPLVGPYKCPTVVTDVSFGYKSSDEGLNGIHGQKNLKKRWDFVKKSDRQLPFNDLQLYAGPIRWYSSPYDWQLDSSYLGDNISFICEWRGTNFVPGTGLSLQKCDWPSILH